MTRYASVLVISLVIAVAAYADVGPVQLDPADGACGYAEPIHCPGWTDLVTWTQVADALEPFRRAGSGVIGNYFYCFGSQYTIPAQAYNLTTQQWEASTPPPLGNCNWCGVETNDALYLVGRFDGLYHNEIQKFTPTGGGPTGTWTQVANYPLALCGIAAAWDGGNFIYASGGSTTLTNAYKYDIANDVWTPIANLPEPMRYCGGAFAGGKYYCMGGFETPFANYEYDPATDTWTAKAPPPVGMTFPLFNLTSDGEHVISIGGGGHSSSWPPSDAVQIYDPATDTWSAETPLPEPIGVNSASYVADGLAVSAGGNDMVVDVATTYEGDGFPGAAPPPDVTVTLTPYGTPIVIPATGGSFSFGISVTNNETGPVTFDVWTDATLPSGAPFGPIIGPINLTFAGGQSVSRNRSQSVPQCLCRLLSGHGLRFRFLHLYQVNHRRRRCLDRRLVYFG